MKASIADGYGDRLTVDADPNLGTGRVYVTAEGTDSALEPISLDFSLTPKKARRLAKALLQSAKEIER